MSLEGVSTELAGLRQLVSFPQNYDKQNWFPAKLPRAMEGSGLAHFLDPGKSQNYLMLEAKLEQPRQDRAASARTLSRQARLCMPASEVSPLLSCHRDLSYMVHKLCLLMERLVLGGEEKEANKNN